MAVAQQEFQQHFPRDGWVEHDANEIWDSQLSVALEVLASNDISATDIATIGITNQRETTVLWDRKTGTPLHPAIVWQDRRTAKFCRELKEEGHEPTIQEKTGLRIDPYFSGTKLCWLLDNVSNARARAERGELAFGTIDSWLLWNLSDGQVHATDVTNASRTLLFNIEEGCWDEGILRLLNIPQSLLPTVQPSSSHFSKCKIEGLEGLSITGMAGDQQAALFGQNCVDASKAKNTYGTGCFLLRPTEQGIVHSKHNLLTTLTCNTDEQLGYAIEGSVFTAGAVIQWLRDGIGMIKSSSESEALAASVKDNGGIYLVPAFTGLGAPHWDPHARGTLCGITRGTTAAHITRAALESIAFQSADLLLAINEDYSTSIEELRVDGGAANNNFLMQFQADLMQVPVVRPQITETTALGAAYLAGLSTGFWKDTSEIASHWKTDRIFEPKISADAAAAQQCLWKKALERSKDWATS